MRLPELEDDEFRLGGRLAYLMVLMRRGRPGRDPVGRRGRGGPKGESQGRVLKLLAMHSPVSQKELAYVLGIRSQSAAEVVAKLERAELVTRRPDDTDRRTSLVELTAAGREEVDRLSIDSEVDPFAPLSDAEKQQLADLLDQVITGLEGGLPDGPDPRLARFKDLAYGASPTDEDGEPFPGAPGLDDGGGAHGTDEGAV
ncbi:Transcriptional regulator, MarR family [Actinomycetales bacterium JB111]|nr:Transcriptional regulator, MarR family [Actinomycetales bacterium JB111]